MKSRVLSLSLGLLLALAGTASAQSIKLEFANGLVNLKADNASVRAILAEWTRLGGTNIVNGDRVSGAPVTLELQGVQERYAMDLILRGVAGYMIAARETPGRGASRFDRVMILPTSTAPRTTTQTNTATFAPPPRQIPDDIDDIDDDVDIGELRRRDQEAVRRAEELARQRLSDQAQRLADQANTLRDRVTGQPVITREIGGPTLRQGTPFVAPPPPGMPPVSQTPGAQINVGPGARPTNPFTVGPGSARPGEVTPPPPQENRPPNADER
jgi:hypothetical protein